MKRAETLLGSGLGRIKRSFGESLDKRRQRQDEREGLYQQTKEKAQILQDQMRKIEAFVGTKAEYEVLKGELYDYVDVPGNDKYLRGSGARVAFAVSPDYGSPYLNDRGSIFSKAVKVGADAVVSLTISALDSSGSVYFGIPVRKHIESQDPAPRSRW